MLGLFPELRERQGQLGGLLSGGEQQMLAIGRALMTNPRLLLLDEASEGLAPRIRAEIWRVLAGLKAAGQAILLIDKNIAPLLRLADRHYILEKGRTVWSGSSAELAGAVELQHRYLGCDGAARGQGQNRLFDAGALSGYCQARHERKKPSRGRNLRRRDLATQRRRSARGWGEAREPRRRPIIDRSLRLPSLKPGSRR